MRRFNVVVNDCAAPGVTGLLHVRSLATQHGQRNFTANFDDLARGLPAQLDDRQLDWLEILGHLFAVDMACERGLGDVDWSRGISVWLPVRDPVFWQAHRATLEGIWTDLTFDDLDIHFEQADSPAAAPRMSTTPFPDHDAVALLSGGQDSFVGALDLLDAGITPLFLSHIASGAVNSAQVSVENILTSIKPEVARVRLGATKARNMSFPGSESSQRSRTLLFLGAAAVVAAAGGSNRVFLNENGIMALHLPLTSARVGSLSTHTASPPIVARIAKLASTVLGCDIGIENRLVRMTKPEVIARAVALGHGADMVHTVSCWQIGRTHKHCGICSPCLLRRISCELHGVQDSVYGADVFDDASSLDDRRARDNLTHLISLVEDLHEYTDEELEGEYPELLNGYPVMTLAEAIDLHRRWGVEAAAVLFSHPVPASLR